MSKTRVNRKLPSVKELIIRHSKARVVVASRKAYPYQGSALGFNRSRPIHRLDVIETMVRAYA